MPLDWQTVCLTQDCMKGKGSSCPALSVIIKVMMSTNKAGNQYG